ncbi:MAG: hypothetical protein WAM82_31925 [Thermoanaerobaculia bacterium]
MQTKGLILLLSTAFLVWLSGAGPAAAKPQVTILQPANNSHTSYGGLNSVQFLGQVIPANCCQLTWTSDKDGALGSGQSRDVFFTSPGDRIITLTAKDSNNVVVATAKITLHVDNDAPVVSILKPTANAKVFRNIPFIIKGSSSDINQSSRKLHNYQKGEGLRHEVKQINRGRG